MTVYVHMGILALGVGKGFRKSLLCFSTVMYVYVRRGDTGAR
jgi:hypothetical protein